MKKMVERVKNFELFVEEEAQNLITELKEENKTYGEVIEALNTNFGASAYNKIIEEARVLLKKEISDLPLGEGKPLN